MTVNLESGVRVAVRAPKPPRWATTPPSAQRAVVVPVRGVPGPPGPAGMSSGEADAAALVSHVLAPEPHPAYDDIADLTLLFENGLI